MHYHCVDDISCADINKREQNTDEECEEELLEIAVPKTEHNARHRTADEFTVTDGPVDKELSE